MTGHIKLGLTAATLQEYMLDDVRRRRRQLANPMAVRLGTGGEFSDYENWALHVAADWREGVGKLAEDAAGYLFGEIESRVPEQLIIPSALGCSAMQFASSDVGERPSYFPEEATEYTAIAIGGTGNPTRISVPIYVYSGTEANLRGYLSGVAFFGYVPDGVEVTVAVYSDTAGAPNAALASGTLTAATLRPGFQWYYVPLSAEYAVTAGSGLTGHWVIYPTNSANEIQFAQGDGSPISGRNSYTYSGSWSVNTGACPFFLYKRPATLQTSANVKHAGFRGFVIDTETNDIVAVSTLQRTTDGAYSDTVTQAFTYDDVANVWERSAYGGSNWPGSVTPEMVGNIVLFNGVVYNPQTTQWTTWTLAGDAVATSTEDANLFASWSGYLWRAYANRLWYSADATTWTEIEGGVGVDDYRVRGLAGLGANMYVSTDEALYYVAPGDAVVGVFPWGTISEENGRGMIAHQGAVYIPAAGRLWKFTEDGSTQDIWVNRDDDLNARRLGNIAALASLNNALVCGVNGTTTDDPSSVWAYTGLGWHHLATLPGGFDIRSLYYDRVRSRLWIASDEWAVFYIHAPDWALNPYNDSASVYMPVGWVETDRIFAGSRDLLKDVEDMRLFGEFGADTSVAVYWQDQDSTDWELLGEFDADGEEVRWADTTTRPSTRWIRIGLLFQTTDPTQTTRLRAWVLKVMPMVRDRWRWDFTINVADNQQMIGGEMNDRYADEMRDHLESLIESVAPVLFEDVDGRQYWVKIMGAGESLDNYENDGYGDVRWSMKFNMSLEQIESVF